MTILLGVTGCIAAYKAAELVRLLQKGGCDVKVVLTRHARQFVAPLTLAALSRHRVITDMYDDQGEGSDVSIEHIEIAQAADVFLVAPATANCLAKLANGIADDFLSTLFLATRAPVVVAPAMNVQMWHHPSVQENLEKLRRLGVHIIEPEEGYLAEGIIGKGRLAQLETIAETVIRLSRPKKDLLGQTVLVTAGPTCEDIDPVRFLTNRSSGKMGYEVARAAQQRGARTILVSGPTQLDAPTGVEFFGVRSADEMRARVLEQFSEATVVIKAAAVADFKPSEIATSKIKKGDAVRTLELSPTPDILRELGQRKRHQFLVGFAAETDQALEYGRQKMNAKNLDMIVINDVTEKGAGFDVDTNVVTIVRSDGRSIQLGERSKHDIAHAILDEVLALKGVQAPSSDPQ